MRSAVLALVLLAGVAYADETTSVRETTLLEKGTDPLLHLDPVVLPGLAGLGTRADTHERTMMQLGGHTWAELEGVHWTNQDVDRRFMNDETTPERGWTASVRLSRDFGPFQASLLARVGEIDSQQALLAQRLAGDRSRFSPGHYYDLGLTIGKSQKLSRWMTAWIALTLGYRGWIGTPPGDEKGGGQVMLSVGTTFR